MNRKLLNRALQAITNPLKDYDFSKQKQLVADLRAELEKQETQDANLALTYARGYDSGKEYLANQIRRVLAGEPAPSTIDLGLFEIADKSTVANINLDDGVYRLYAVRAKK